MGVSGSSTTVAGGGQTTMTGPAGAAGGTASSGAPGTTAKAGGSAPANHSTPITATTIPRARPAPAGSAVGAQPGRYTYSESGTASSSFQPGEQPINGQSILTVDPAAGSDQHTAREAPQGSMDTTYRYQAGGVYLTDLKQSTSGFTKEFKADPAALVLAQPATVGKSWQWDLTSTDGLTRVHTTFRVARLETLVIGGESVATVVLDSVVTTAGDVTSTMNSTIWVSEKYKLIVQQHDVSNGSYGAFTFRADRTEKLLATRPS